MRTGLSTIQQTLMPEAATVLNHSIAEAARRNHGQTTPLHVAATLLASPMGFLRQACIRSHPNSSHPLQCRALELCFSVALDRLPSAATPTNPSGGVMVREPPISNALMAALKRAQAHQRRCCPEQQQQPLLAVKVELEQLVVSILDDPSVSRVMREASFSSPAVKAAVEQAMTSTSSASSSTIAAPTASVAASPSPSPKPILSNSPSLTNSSRLGSLGPPRPTPVPLLPANRNPYLNPRLQQQQQQPAPQMTSALFSTPQPVREEEVKKVLDILRRDKKRNPVLVGDSEPEALMREVLRRIEKREFGEGDPLGEAQVLSLEKEFAGDKPHVPHILGKVGDSVESCKGGVLLNLGDLRWLVEAPSEPVGNPPAGSDPAQQRQPPVSMVGRMAVVEMRKLLQRLANRPVWLTGTASCATYLRCQVYHPTMESDWDLQALPIAARTLPPAMLPRNLNPQNEILSSSMNGYLAPPKGGLPTLSMTTVSSAGNSPLPKKTLISMCTDDYEKELTKLVAAESNNSSDSKPAEDQASLPRWLEAAKPGNESSDGSASDHLLELHRKDSADELAKKWSETSLTFHPSSNSPFPPISDPKVLQAQSFGPIRHSNFISKPVPRVQPPPVSPPGSPVRTDLVLGQPKAPAVEPKQAPRTDSWVDCTLDLFSKQYQRSEMQPETDSLKTLIKGLSAMNPESDSFKTLYKGLSEKVGWQLEAAAAVAVTVMRCKSGNGKRRALGLRPDIWLLFLGPDRVGKMKMAKALAELVFGNGSSLVTVSFSSATRESGGDGESITRFRGKTPIDRIAETIRRKPFSVFLLEDVDQADPLVRGTIKRAMERGRLPDSHGREVSLGSAVFIMTIHSLSENRDTPAMESLIQPEKKLEGVVTNSNCGWRLELQVGERTGKRRENWQCEDQRSVKPRKEMDSGLSLDLNLGLASDDTMEGSRNSSDLTVEQDQIHEVGRVPTVKQPSLRLPSEFIDVVDDAIVFKAVDLVPLKKKISEALTARFSSILGGGRAVKIDEDTLDWIVSGIWFRDDAADSEKWVEQVLAPAFKQFNSNIKIVSGDAQVLRLVAVKECSPATSSDHFPSRLAIVDDRGPLLLA